MICVAGHQPNLYPYGGFFAKALYVDKFVIVDNTQYVKKQYHNRNRIKLVNENTIWLSIPVINSGRFKQLINEVEIDNSQNWRKKHINTLKTNYSKAAFYSDYAPEIISLIGRNWNKLADFNISFIRLMMDLIGIDTELHLASELGIKGKATELIIDICRKCDADSYLHGMHSRDYVDFGDLTKAGYTNLIQDFRSVEYDQVGNCFVENLSILDILFNCGSGTKEVLEKGNFISES